MPRTVALVILCLVALAGGVAWYQQPALRQARLNQWLVAAVGSPVGARDEAAVASALAAGADPNTRNYYRDPPSLWLRLRYPRNVPDAEQNYRASWEPVLMTAVREDDAPMMTALLNHGANVNARDALGGGTLAPAVAPGCVTGLPDLAVLKLLLGHGADKGCRDEALCTAAVWGDVPAARLLIARGANANTHLFRWGSTETPLMNACEFQNREMIALLIQQGADVNFHDERHFTPLREASGGRHPDPVIIQMLKKAGAKS